MHIARRLLREFWLPTLVAIAWTGFNVYSTKLWDLKSIVNIFGPSFFLASWATGQFFRLQKQAGVEKSFATMEDRVTRLIDRVEKHTTDFLGYTTGGDSWVSFMCGFSSNETMELMLWNESKYPVFDIHAEVIDLDEPIDPERGVLWTRHPFVLESLYPSKIISRAYAFNVRGRDRLKLNVFIQTRSNGVIQEFRIARVGNWFSTAIRTRVDGIVVKVAVPEDYPGRDAANPEAVFA